MKTLEDVNWFKSRSTMRLYRNIDDPRSDWVHVVCEYFMQVDKPWLLTVELIRYSDDGESTLRTEEYLYENYESSASAYTALKDCVRKIGMENYGSNCFTIPMKEN